jgi:hypothetical protein
VSFGPSGTARIGTGATTVPADGLVAIPIAMPADWRLAPVFAALRDALTVYDRIRPIVGAPPTGEATPDPDVVEHMRALGYVE